MQNDRLTITQFAAAAGLTPQAVRFLISSKALLVDSRKAIPADLVWLAKSKWANRGQKRLKREIIAEASNTLAS